MIQEAVGPRQFPSPLGAMPNLPQDQLPTPKVRSQSALSRLAGTKLQAVSLFC